MPRNPTKTATIFDEESVNKQPEVDLQEGENHVIKPEDGGDKGFKMEANQYGHMVIVWEDGNRVVPSMLQGAWTNRAKAEQAIAGYFAERRAPRERNPILDKVGV